MYIVNHLPATENIKAETDCCTLINPIDWDGQVFEFKDKLFIHVRTLSFMHIPLNMNSVMKRTMKVIEEFGAEAPPSEFVMLTDDSSAWHSDHLIAVSDEVPVLEMEKISGTFLAKVFEGPYKDVQKWYGQLIDYVFSRGYEPVRTFFYYTACPKCAKKFEKNYVIGFEQIE